MALLAIVDPKEWVKRTSLMLSRTRGPSLLKVDEAYTDYFKVRSEENKQKLHDALGAYLMEKGGHWEKVDRNKKSDGLMKFIYEKTADAVAKNVLAKRIPEARHGVIYLWQNADVSTQWAKILLEGALNIGGSTLGMLQASNYEAGDKLKGLGVIAKKTKGDTLASIGQLAPTIGGILAKPTGTGVEPETPTPVVKLVALTEDPGLLEKAKAALGKFFTKVYETIKQAVTAMWDEQRLKYYRGGFIGTIGTSVGKLVLFILGKVAKHAAPFVSAGIDIGQGICQAIIAAKDRVVAYLARKKFMVAPGHPMQIANSIQTQMNWAIAKGLYNAAKGGIKLAGNIASFGASALVDVIAACVEFAWKFITRMAEGYWMRDWIGTLKSHTNNRNNWKADPNDGKWRPSIVYNDRAFKALFEMGCESSVCVPMMTLNSGIAGDQMMFMKMFDDTGAILGQHAPMQIMPSKAALAEFEAATNYFTQLKEWGRNYLESTGFTFNSTDRVAQGLMRHAIKDHQGGKMATGDKVLSFLAGN